MTTKIRQTDSHTWIVYESNDTDETEYDEFDNLSEALEYRSDLDEWASWNDSDLKNASI